MTTLPQMFRSHSLRAVAATLVVAVAGAVMLNVAEAAPHGGGPGMMLMGGQHVDKMLDAVNASAEQRTQVKAIADAARADLRSQREAGRSLREQMLTLFTQPTVDARSAESLRQQQMAQHDAASKRMVQAMLEISRVLSVEQRQQLGQQMAQRRALMERQRGERETRDGARR